MTRYGYAFFLKLQMISTAFGLKRLQAGKILFAKMEQQVELLFYFELAFDFVDLGKKFCALCFDQIMGVYRPGTYAAKRYQVAERKLIHQFGIFLFEYCRLNPN